MKKVELVEKRGKKEKHFLQHDGSIVAVMYNDNIHYKKNGKYEEIDNTLIEDDDSYSNRSNDYKVHFQKNSENSLMMVEKDDNYIEIQLKQCNNVQAKKYVDDFVSAEIVSYRDIFDGIDLDYQLLPTKVKETIVLHDYKNIKEKISFIIKSNLNLVLNNDIIIAEKDDEIVFSLDAPYMIDSSGKTNKDIYYKLHNKEEYYELDLILNLEWLNSKETIYPVYIDPTITNYSEENSVYDTYIYPGDTGIDKNSQDILKAGVEKINGVDTINRALLKFDLPDIGTSSEIIDATLFLIGYPAANGTSTIKTAVVHRITEDWDETNANWENMNSKYDQDRIEAIINCNRSFYTTDEEGKIVISPVSNYAYLTNLVKKWYTDTPNYGVMVKLPEEVYTDDKYPAFFSKNNSAQGYNPKPTLEIVYRNQNGLESYLDYKTQQMTDGDIYVNTFNGNLTGVWNLGSTIGGQLPASVKLVYNTNDAILNKNTAFGNGYRLNLDQTIREELIDGNAWLEYTDEDGTIHYFYNNPSVNDALYYDEDGINLTIEKQENNYIMKDKNSNKITFVKNGETYYLNKIEDVSNNKIEITRDTNNLITKVIDASNSEINFSYENDKINIVNPVYTTEVILSGGVTSITTINGTTNISYNENNLIDTITDVTGIKVKYEYYSEKSYKVYKVTQYGLNNALGNYFTFDYGFDVTTITDNKERTETLIFNALGNVISRNSLSNSEDISNAYSISGTYGDEQSNKNKILSDVIPVRYVKNYLENTSFEEEDDSIFTVTSGIEYSYSTECSVSGYRSLKLVSNQDNEVMVLGPSSWPLMGKYYTFSGYFKNDQPIDLTIGSWDASHMTIDNTIQIESSNDFVRHDISLYYPEDAMGGVYVRVSLPNTGTTVYMDDIQLEEGKIVNNYNIIENSDFSDGLTDWTLEAVKYGTQESEDGTIVDTILSPNGIFEVVDFNNNQNKALKVKMNPLNKTSFSKEFPVKGKQGDIYRISFWYKNEGIEADNTLISNNVHMYFIPADGSIPEYCIPTSTSFPPNQNIWQYFSYEVGADYDYNGMKLVFNQGRNANDFYITNLTLYKDIGTNYFEYDENGNVASIKDSIERTNVFSYDSNNQLISSTTPRGKNFKYEYDNDKTDQVLSAISSMGISNQIKYDSFGNPILTKIMKKGSEELLDGIYKIRNKGTDKYLKAEYSSVFVESDSCSNTVWDLEKTGDEFKIKYHIISSYYLSYINNSVILNTSDSNNLFVLEKNDNGSCYIKLKTEGTEIDSDGKPIAKYLKANGTVLEISSMINNDPTFEFYFEVVGEEFIENSATYSEDGRFITSVTDSLFNKTQYVTDSTTGLVTSMINANSETTNYTYNGKKQITSITQGDKTVNYTYDDKNLLSKITQGNKEYKFTYDDFLNMKKVMIGDTITLVTNDYEENNGNLLKTTYGNNQDISFEYDEFDRIKTVHKMDEDYHYIYDNSGSVAKILLSSPITTYDTGGDVEVPEITDSNEILYNSIIKYSYDIGKRVQEYRNDNFKINYNYDSNNNVTDKIYKLEDKIHSIENTFDKDDNLIKSMIGTAAVNYVYDDLGRIESRNINEIYNIDYDYVSNGKRTSTLIKSIKNGNNKYSYQYDKLNNITHIYYNDELLKQYYYDEYNELVKEDNYSTDERIEYIYDNSGNLLTKITTNMTTSDIIKTDTYQYANTNWEDQLTSYNGNSINYDNIGNPLTIGNNITMNWINGRSLNTYTDTSKNLNINYKYNRDGIRVSKVVNEVETKYYLENSNIIYEQRGDNIIYYLYDLAGLIGLEYNGNLFYYIKNLQGDIIGILDSSYNQIVSYEYDSWGKVLSIKDSQGNEITDTTNIGLINPFRYRGYYYDSETELYYLNSRYYNPEWGRFINADGILGANKDILGYNLYAYVSNNPINNVDSTGRFFKKAWNWIKKTVNGAKNVAASAIKSVVRAAWQPVIKTLETMNMKTSAEMLQYSLQDNPKPLTYTDGSRVVNQIKNDSTFKKIVSGAINNPSNGNVYADVWTKFETTTDLHGSLHGSHVMIDGTMNDGCANLNVSITDYYDFDFSWGYFDGNNIIKSFIFTTGNNMAWSDQGTGVVQNYDVFITFSYDVCP